MVNVRLHNDDALQTENVDQMKNVCSLVNVFAHRHSFWIQAMVENAKTHVNDTLAVSMPNVHHPIRHSACVKLDSKATHCKVVSMKMVSSKENDNLSNSIESLLTTLNFQNVQLMEIHAPMVHNV